MQKRLTIKAADTAADIKTDAYGILASVCRVQSAGITPILSSLEKGLYNITSTVFPAKSSGSGIFTWEYAESPLASRLSNITSPSTAIRAAALKEFIYSCPSLRSGSTASIIRYCPPESRIASSTFSISVMFPDADGYTNRRGLYVYFRFIRSCSCSDGERINADNKEMRKTVSPNTAVIIILFRLKNLRKTIGTAPLS